MGVPLRRESATLPPVREGPKPGAIMRLSNSIGCIAALALVIVALHGCAADDADGDPKFESTGGGADGAAAADASDKLDWETYPGAVVDPKSKLMWQRVVDPTKRNWADAKTYCQDLLLAKLDDWRLPHKDDLCTIFETSGTTPAIDLKAFPDTPAAPFWTATKQNSTHAYGVAFDQASSKVCQEGYEAFELLHYVRCVR